MIRRRLRLRRRGDGAPASPDETVEDPALIRPRGGYSNSMLNGLHLVYRLKRGHGTTN